MDSQPNGDGQPPFHADAALLDLLPAAVYLCEAPSGAVVRYNRRAAELWGRAPALGDSCERFCGSYRLYRTDGTALATVLIGKSEGERLYVKTSAAPAIYAIDPKLLQLPKIPDDLLS